MDALMQGASFCSGVQGGALAVRVGPRSERYADNTVRLSKIKGSTVRCSMTPNPRTIAPTSTIKDAAGRMLRFGHNRLMVADEGRLVGLLSATDVIKLALCNDDA